VATPKDEGSRKRNRSKKEEEKVMCGHLSSKYLTAKLAQTCIDKKNNFFIKKP
jgi:hypothetical protein